MSLYSSKIFILNNIKIQGSRKSFACLLGFMLMIMSLVPSIAIADSDAGDFDTTSYMVKMSVNKDASARVTEDISVNIHSPMHGIYRYIPFSRKIDYEAGGSRIRQSYAAMKLGNVSVDIDPYEKYRESGNMVIRIGDEDKTVSGKKDYSLSYDVQMYKDDTDNYDTFYYNVLPFGWETAIDEAKITLAMPSSFEKKNVNVLVGSRGRSNMNDKVTWQKKGNTLVIESKEKLPQGCGITVGIKLPEGFFKDAPSHRLFNAVMYGIAALFIALMGLLWYRFGRDPKHIQTVEFYPPDDITSADVGYIIDGYVDKEDVVSLIMYFAQQGYLSISEEGKKDYVIHKEADLPPMVKSYERVFFDGLFETSSSVRLSDLKEEFYDTYEACKEMIESEFKGKDNKIFYGRANAIRAAAYLIPLIAAGLMGWMIWRVFGSALLVAATVLLVVCAGAGYAGGMYIQDRRYTKAAGKRVLFSVSSIALTAASMLLAIYIIVSVLGNWILAVLFALVIGMGYFATRFMRSRTKRGAELLGKILGFKEFIRVAEKDRLEKMVETDPQYYYNILPYAYVLGLSKKWAKKFEDIAVERPEWYRSTRDDGMFNTWMFYNSMNNFSRYAGASISVPSVDDVGGGFDGGGGFSAGGGFGGGGGGGW